MSKPDNVLERVLQNYGDLLFDLCESVLWSPSGAQIAFQTILKELKKSHPSNRYTQYERAWVLKIACERLRKLSRKFARRLSPAEQIMLDSSVAVTSRLKHFDSYFHRLGTDDQILLLLRDKYGLTYLEISAALGLPEGTLKTRRQQALRTLEEWLWDRE